MTIATRADALVLVAGLNQVRRASLAETRRVLEACPALKLGFIATGGNGGGALRLPVPQRGSPRGAGRCLTSWSRRRGPTRVSAPSTDDVVRAPSSSAGLNARGGSLRRLVGVSDALALVLAFLLSGLVAPSMHGRSGSLAVGLVLFAATLPAWLVGARLTGLYRLDERRANGGGVEEWLSIGRLMVIGTWVVLAIAWVARFEQPETARLVVFAALAVTFAASGRVAARALARRRSAYVQNAVIVGAGEVGQLVARKLLRHPEYGVNLVGFVDTPPKRWRRDISPGPLLGPVDDLAAIVRRFAVQRVIVAFSQRNDNDVLAQVRPLAGLNVHVDVVPRMFEIIGPDHGLPDVEGIPLVSISPRTPSAASLRVKRAIDVAGACLGLVLTAPVFLWAAWKIPRETPGPVFYRQTRLGADMQRVHDAQVPHHAGGCGHRVAPGLRRADDERRAGRGAARSTSSTVTT